MYSKALSEKSLITAQSKEKIRTDDEVIQTTIGLLDIPKEENKDDKGSQYGEKLYTIMKIIKAMLTNDMFLGEPQNYIYFNGYNSGISFNKNMFTKVINDH